MLHRLKQILSPLLYLSSRGGVSACTLALLVLSVALSATAVAMPRYTVRSLPGLRPTAFNDLGQVVGLGFAGGSPYAALWQDGQITDLGELAPGLSAEALGINNLGQVVGYAGHSTYIDEWGQHTRWHAFIWDSSSGMVDLGSPDGGDTRAYDINNLGQVVMVDYGPDGDRAMLWDSASGMKAISPPGLNSYPVSVNDLGQVVWNTRGPNSGISPCAVFWDTTNGMQYILDQPGLICAGARMNNSGQVVGHTATFDAYKSQPFIWDSVSGMRMLDCSPGPRTEAADINDQGVVVGLGAAQVGDWPTLHALVWYGDSRADLNDLIPQEAGIELTAAIAINNRGQILAASYGEDYSYYYLLDPVPEPSSLSLLSLALASAGAWRLRRRR